MASKLPGHTAAVAAAAATGSEARRDSELGSVFLGHGWPPAEATGRADSCERSDSASEELRAQQQQQQQQQPQQSFGSSASSSPLGSPSSASGQASAALQWDPNSFACAELEDHRSSLPMTAFNVINSIIGSGVIGMPYALKCSGIGLGLLLLVAVALITDYSINLIIMGGALSNTLTYQDMVRVAFGRPGYIAVTIMQAAYPVISMISYNIIIGDSITKIVHRIAGDRGAQSVFANRNFVVFLATIFVCLPLSLYKNVSKLSKTSLLSTVIVCLIMISMAVRASSYASQVIPPNYEWEFANTQIPQAVSIMAAAFMCQHNSYMCYRSLQRRSLSRWSVVVHLSVVSAMLLLALFGLLGFATFAAAAQGDILQNYCTGDDVINFARLLFAASLVLTYPMECFVVRQVVENFFFQHLLAAPLWRHVALTGAIVGCVFVASTATSCLSVVLELNGILTAAPLAFILPPLCVLRLQHEPFLRPANLPLLATAAFGVAVAGSGCAVVVLELWRRGARCGDVSADTWIQQQQQQQHYCLAAANASSADVG